MEETQKKRDFKDYGFILLIIPIVSLILIWFWIGSMNLLQNPGSTLTGLVVVTIIITAIIAAMEVNAFQKTSQKKVESPLSYFLIITLLWIVGYPLYFYRRRKWGFSNLFIGGILVMIIFVFSTVSIWSAIENRKAEIRNELTGTSTQTSKSSVQRITKSKYDLIFPGASYETVVKILGVEGEEISSSYVEGIEGVMESTTIKIYSWENDDGSNMNATFENNKLTNKAQFGLK